MNMKLVLGVARKRANNKHAELIVILGISKAIPVQAVEACRVMRRRGSHIC
jgi:hypothetical protein